jgi:hypothetical protein
MTNKEAFYLTLLSIAIAFSAFCWVLASISFAATFNNTVWLGLIHFNDFLVTIGMKPPGHCTIANDWLCGMSHAFRFLWRGNIKEALSYNANSLWLFTVMILGFLLGFVLLLYRPLHSHKF